MLAVAGHESFGSRLGGWTPAMVQAAVRGRLAGLASWHPDGTISAHPLVRDTFRPLVMAAAGIAADTALAGMPAGTVANRADALRVVEVIEVLLDAGQWQAADDVYQGRCGGDVWKHLPAARLGQRAATAFVATPGRRAACATQLDANRLGDYLNEVGFFAMYEGDLPTAAEYLSLVIRLDRDSGETANLAVSLRNLADCLGHLGQVAPGQEAAAEALACSETIGEWWPIHASHAHMGRLAALVGNTAEAEQQFLAADQVCEDHEGNHLYAVYGSWWANFLALTGRQEPTLILTRHNLDTCRNYNWNEHVAQCDQVLGRLALTAGDAEAAGGT